MWRVLWLLLTATILLGMATASPPRILLPRDDAVWVCAEYEQGASCVPAGVVKTIILENGPRDASSLDEAP